MPRPTPPLLFHVCLLHACLLAWAASPVPASAQAVTIYRCIDAAGDLTVQNRPCPAGTTQREQQVQDVAGPAAAATGSTATPATAATPPWPTAAPGTLSPQSPALQSVERSSDGGFVTTGTGAAPLTLGNIDLPAISPTQEPQRSSDGGFITTSVGPEPRILDSANLPRDTPPEQDAEPDPDRLPPPPLFQCSTHDGDSYLSEEQEVPPRCLPLRTVGLDGNPMTGAGMACEVVRDTCARVADGGACEAWRRHAREAQSRWRFAHPDNVERRRAEYERLEKIVAESCGG